MKIYDNKKRENVPTKFKVGQKVFRQGKEYEIKVIDAWSPTEIYLALENPTMNTAFLVVEAQEVKTC